MVFLEFNDIEEIDDVDFNSCPFSLYFLCILIILFSKKFSRTLVSKVGTVIEVEN